MTLMDFLGGYFYEDNLDGYSGSPEMDIAKKNQGKFFCLSAITFMLHHSYSFSTLPILVSLLCGFVLFKEISQ